jgi:hypothetical protein
MVCGGIADLYDFRRCSYEIWLLGLKYSEFGKREAGDLPLWQKTLLHLMELETGLKR